MKISPARVAAYHALIRIENERAFSSTLLSQFEESLDARDASLCHAIVLGVLRRRIHLDRLIAALTENRPLDPEVRTILRIGLFQIIHLERVPGFSIVNDAVSLVQRARKTSARGLVNAVLRRASVQVPEITYADDIDRISVLTSHPRWLLEKWARSFGSQMAFDIAAANNASPHLTFRPTIKGRGLKLSTLGVASGHFEGSYAAARMTPTLRAAAAAGQVYFQDEGSQLVAQAISDSRFDRFLDVCASPGSKTTYIAKEAKGMPSLIVAGDLDDHRVRLLSENCERQGASAVKICRYDAESALPFARDTFDLVLVDAPCSGTGTIRHNPEIRYFLAPDDFQMLRSKQLAILTNASKVVKHGGRLIYSTCSLETEENESVIGGFLQANSEYRTIEPSVPRRFITDEGFARTFPHRDSMDGFFIAALRKAVP